MLSPLVGIWAADLKSFYSMISLEKLDDQQVKNSILLRQAEITGKRGNDSVLTVFLAVDLDKSYFAEKSSEHFFYTPSRSGQSLAGALPVDGERGAIETWLKKFFQLTTYEISCPVMRDESLAPAGKTGLIISVLFDYQLTRRIEEQGWYEEFKVFCEQAVIKTLDSSIYPGIRHAVLHQFSSTPLTMARLASNFEGAITGWAFTNHPMPAENRLPKIMNAVKTPIPGVFQAGQWTYSPAGLPISIITGKIAADGVIKALAKGK